jgi:crotonobetainyl-CoA hydratase
MTDAGFTHCRLERDGQIFTITINRPEVLNALNPGAHAELARAFDLYRDDPGLNVAIITGAGDRAFCVGTDLKELARTGDHNKPPSGFVAASRRGLTCSNR